MYKYSTTICQFMNLIGLRSSAPIHPSELIPKAARRGQAPGAHAAHAVRRRNSPWQMPNNGWFMALLYLVDLY